MKSVLLCMVIILGLGQALGADTGKLQHPDQARLRMVFFTPSDVDPPEGVEERMRQIADYTQQFFSHWMTHWGYPPAQALALDRSAAGIPEILYVRGRETEASGVYRRLGFQEEVVQTAIRQYRIRPQGQVWWIFMYQGPQENWGRGMGDFRRGGISTARFYTEPGEIKVGADMADGFLREIMLKGAIHEFGHALGLPHIGPKDTDQLGNSLMGPVNKVYSGRKDPSERRVYLSRAAAAMLWRHPLFTGSRAGVDQTPELDVSDFRIAPGKDGGPATVVGTLDSSIPVHSVIVAEASRNPRNDYWTQTSVGRIAPDGSFTVRIDPLTERSGTLNVVFCCENGAVKGTTKGRGFSGGFPLTYRNQDGAIVPVESP